MNNAQFDLIVVGAGILGLSAAIQAQEQGSKVCIFRKNAKPVGAARVNFGMASEASTLTHPEQQWRKYALETRSFYQRIQTETDISFAQRQGVYLANTALEWQVLNGALAERANNYQIAVHLFSHGGIGHPIFLFKSFAAVSRRFGFSKKIIRSEPHVVGQRLLAYAERKGVNIYTNARVVFKPNINMKFVRFAWQSGEAYRANKVLGSATVKSSMFYIRISYKA
ncbi:FAD-dependent oxidoreductase [Acinetobacter baumannii]